MTALLRDNNRLLWFWVRHYAAACSELAVIDPEDLYQAGFFGLLDASATFDPERGSWGTWASFYIRKRMLAELEAQSANLRRMNKALPLDAPAYPADDENDTVLQETIPDPTIPDMLEAAADEDTAQIVRKAVADLESPEVRQTIAGYYFEEKTMRQLAEAQGETASTIRKLHGQGLRTLRKARSIRMLRESMLDQETRYHAHKGLTAFWNTRSSVVEDCVIRREQLRSHIGIEKTEG